MKTTYLIASLAFCFIASCERHESEKVKDKVNDALDRRPNEKLRDAGEDIGDAAKDAGKDLKDAAKDLKEDVKDATR